MPEFGKRLEGSPEGSPEVSLEGSLGGSVDAAQGACISLTHATYDLLGCMRTMHA